jgi:putative phosphoribosyl transferase
MTKLEEGPRAQNLPREREVRIPAGRVALGGDLVVPDSANGIVLFAHGSGSSRHSPRNRYVAQVLQRTGLATLLMDLLTPDEDALDAQTAALRFDIELLAGRLLEATSRVENRQRMAHLAIGYFGASIGAAAALVARIQPQSLG